jgi:hypothetical protein
MPSSCHHHGASAPGAASGKVRETWNVALCRTYENMLGIPCPITANRATAWNPGKR